MALSKPSEYQEVPARQSEETVYAEDINQIISNIEKIKGGQANKAPVSNIQQLNQDIKDLETKIINQELPKKQDELKAGRNIIIDENNTIHSTGGSGEGGSSIASDIFYNNNKSLLNADNVQDAIDETCKKVNNIKLEAESISYDNSKTNLEYLSKYDFPKFKTPIADTINLVLASSTSASITKQEDSSYRLQASLNNIPAASDMILIPIKSIEDETKRFGISNILLQFFNNITIVPQANFSNVNYTALETDECSISEIDSPLKFAICEIAASIFIVIKRQDDGSIPQKSYTVTLNIKNRVLRNQDSNLFCLENVANNDTNREYNFLSLEVNESKIAVTGTITNLAVAAESGFYIINNIIPNYFNLNGNYAPTSGIISSSGKSVEYKVIPILTEGDTVYHFALQYTDSTEIQSSDVFTFNLTPDKNSTLDPVYSSADNIQKAIESIVLNKIMPIGSTYIQFAEYAELLESVLSNLASQNLLTEEQKSQLESLTNKRQEIKTQYPKQN